VNKPYLSDPEQIVFTSKAFEGLRLLQQSGVRLILISNQSGIGRGYFTEEEFKAVHYRLIALLEEQQIYFDACYYCPHAPEEHCDCRKPSIGMLKQACEDFAVIQECSWMIGDSECDIKLAQNFSIRSIFLKKSGPCECSEADKTAVCSNLLECAKLIIS